MRTSESFRITAVRLVEFHNLGTTVVDVPDGGHLFLLGDNGSGKTTLLDAVHLVLSGGQEMEFNSAARVAGARDSGGRTIQGIVLRYNAVTGRTMRGAGISCAAVEMRSSAGKVVSFAVGLFAEGMDVAYHSWGGIASSPVRDLPLTVEENGRIRAATQVEFKREMTSGRIAGGRYFAHLKDYRETVANRLFGGAKKYADVCKLLRTGKAYREIAARATNYDELFRQLLEEPQRETFEPLLKGLRELEDSKGRLERIEERVHYLADLKKRCDQRMAARIKAKVVAWAEAERARERAERECAQLREAHGAGEDEAKRLDAAWQTAKDEAERARSRLDDLRRQDATGLLEREKAVAARADAARHKADAAVRQLENDTANVNEAEAARRSAQSAWQTAVRSAAEALQKAGRAADVALGNGTDSLLAAGGREVATDCRQALSDVGAAVDAVRDGRLARAQEARRIADGAGERTARAEALCAALMSQKESVPRVEGFAEMQSALRANMLNARSVYEMLEPASGCDSRHLALLECLAGEDFLATVVADEDEVDRVRQIAWREGASGTVATRETCGGGVEASAPWLGKYVSFEDSDPAAVALLARHLADVAGPVDGDFLKRKTWSFRRREGLMPADRPRLIGLKARTAELARQRREADEARAQAVREQRAAEKAAQAAEEAVRRLHELDALLKRAQMEIAERAEAAQRMDAQAANARQMCERTREDAEERRSEAAAVRDELEDIRLRMRAEGIDGTLERRIASAERALKAKVAEADGIGQKIGGVRGRLEAIAKGCAARAEEAKAAGERAAECAAAFAECRAEGETAADCAARLCPEATAGTADFAALRERFFGDGCVAVKEIERLIRDPKGEPFSFSFDADANRLQDRRGVGIVDVLADETRQLDDLKSTINQKSREVFERIFIGEVMTRLYRDLKQIEDLAHRIQRNLSKRRFGSNRYAFELSPVDQYERFVEFVRKGYLLDMGDEKSGLRECLEAHREEILNADVDQLPDIFDYRRWFRFQLKVLTENEEGRVIDRQVKSLGSGGEQAVPNYLLILTVAEFLYHGGERADAPKAVPLLFDEAFYGIDAARRDQLLAFADDLDLQLFVSSPDQDGVKREIRHSVSLIVVKDENLDVHLSPVVWNNVATQDDLFAAKMV